MNLVSFSVPGAPVPQGGMRAFVHDGRAIVTHKRPKDLGDYRARIALAAQGQPMLEGPISLTATFVLQRPKSHFGTGRNAAKLKPSAPVYVTTRPDIDKLLRSLLDGLTNVCIGDDGQIVLVSVAERFTNEMYPVPCTEVALAELDSSIARAREEKLPL